MIAFTMCTGLAGRLYQSGLLDRMDEAQLALVRAGVKAHLDTRQAVAASSVSFPTGLPSWDSVWVTVAFMGPAETYVLAWRQREAPAQVALRPPQLGTGRVVVEQVYPPVETFAPWRTERTPGGLTITASEPVAAARMLRLTRQR